MSNNVANFEAVDLMLVSIKFYCGLKVSKHLEKLYGKRLLDGKVCPPV